MQTSGKALSAAVWNEDFPEALAVKVELMPFLFPLHMIAGGFALVLAPLAYLLRRNSRQHRVAGRLAAIDVAVAGMSAFPVAWVAPVTFWSALGFSVQGFLWLVLLCCGIAFIRRGHVGRHRASMLLMMALTSGAVLFRIGLASWALVVPGFHYEQFYAFDAWAAWLIPLGGTAWALYRQSLVVGAGNAAPHAR